MQFSIFIPNVIANVSVAPFVSTTQTYDFTYMLKTFSPSDAAVSFKTKVATLNNEKFALFADALETFVRLRLCSAFDARCAPWFELGVPNHVSFSQSQKAHMVWRLAPLLPRQEFCHPVLDPQQLVE